MKGEVKRDHAKADCDGLAHFAGPPRVRSRIGNSPLTKQRENAVGSGLEYTEVRDGAFGMKLELKHHVPWRTVGSKIAGGEKPEHPISDSGHE